MRWTAVLLTCLLGGCHGLSSLDRWNSQPPPTVMPLWESYQQCLTTIDPMTLHQMVEELEQAKIVGSEPPHWMKSWGDHVTKQPLRTAVDPQALAAACTLRVAAVMAESERIADARALYDRVLARYPDPELAYYADHAKDALAALPETAPALLALRNAASSR